MVRMRGVLVSIGGPFAKISASGNRLALTEHRRGHPRRVVGGIPQPDLAQGKRDLARGGRTQPALARSQASGSTLVPLIQTSKCRWLAVDWPVLPTSPMSCPTLTFWPETTWRLP